MTSSSRSAFVLAWRRLTWRVLFLEWLGSLLFLMLAFAWLQIADSHVWQFAFSLISAALLVVGFVWMQTLAFRSLLPRSSGLAPFWRRFLLCIVVLGVWLIVLHWIAAARDHATLYAGYWNSKFAAGQRYFFTYERLIALQQRFWDFAQWTVAAFLLPIAVEGGITGGGLSAWHRIRSVYGHLLYWVVAIVSGFVGSALVAALIHWKPGTGVAQEVASTLIRLGVAYTIVILLVTFLLALAAEYLARAEPDLNEAATMS